jgi:hypothetical protein
MYSKHQRFEGIKRNYSPETVEKLRGSLKIEYTLAKRGTMKLWNYLTRGGNSYINAMGALTGTMRLPCPISQPTVSPISIWRRILVLPARESHSLSQIWWTLQCGAQFAWGFAANEFDMLHFESWNALTTFFASLSTKALKFFFRYDGHVNPRNSNDVEI